MCYTTYDLEVGALEAVPPFWDVSPAGLILCHSGRRDALEALRVPWEHVHSVEDCLEDNSWVQQAYAVATGEPAPGIVVLCANELRPSDPSEIGKLKLATFLKLTSYDCLLQDVVLVLPQLCVKGTPFAVCLPDVGAALVAVLGRLPHVQKATGRRGTIFHNGTVERLYPELFHLLLIWCSVG